MGISLGQMATAMQDPWIAGTAEGTYQLTASGTDSAATLGFGRGWLAVRYARWRFVAHFRAWRAMRGLYGWRAGWGGRVCGTGKLTSRRASCFLLPELMS